MKQLSLFILTTALFCTLKSQTITTIGGNGSAGYTGDGGPATSAALNFPVKVCSDSSGNIYFADDGNNAIRRIDVATGIITTVAGNGTPGYSGDGGPATGAVLNGPWGIAIDPHGNICFSDVGNNVVRKIDINTGLISTIIGNGTPGYSGDGGSALSASFNGVTGLAIDEHGNFFVTDDNNNVIRRIDGATGIVTTIAGNGTYGYGGDGGLAINATLAFPVGISVDGNGNIYLADSDNNRIRKIDHAGIINTIAGNGNSGFNGDGIPATSATLYNPWDVTTDNAGNIYIADFYNCRIRKVDPATGLISTYAGARCGYSGDGGLATSAAMSAPTGLCINRNGDLLIVDTYNNVIRKVFKGPQTAIPSICYLDPATCSWTDIFTSCTATLDLYQGCSTELKMCNATFGTCGPYISWYDNGVLIGYTSQSNQILSYSSNVIGPHTITFNFPGCGSNQCTSGTNSYLQINVIPKPNYLFTASPNPACIGNTVTFTTDADNTSMYPSSGSFGIDFGDGNTSSGVFNPSTGLTTFSHSYGTAGTYNVTLLIEEYFNCLPCSTLLTIPIVVNDAAPTPPTFNPPSHITCGGNGPINLASYASPSGCTFSGPGVTGTTFDPAGIVGTVYITYDCTNGCGPASVTQGITVDPNYCNTSNYFNLGGGSITGIQTFSTPMSSPYGVSSDQWPLNCSYPYRAISNVPRSIDQSHERSDTQNSECLAALLLRHVAGHHC